MSLKMSRRAFLRGSALSSAVAGLGDSGAVLAAAPAGGAPAAGPGPVPIELKVNGAPRTLHVEPRMTLAEALRGPLGLTGTKIACNRGSCGACTLLLDGQAVCGCMVQAIEASGSSITTVEGLAQGETLSPLQAAFIAHDALQCGFCTPGMLMSCSALLQRNPRPSAEDVEDAIAGNLCRCGTYPHVLAAVLAVAGAKGA